MALTTQNVSVNGAAAEPAIFVQRSSDQAIAPAHGILDPTGASVGTAANPLFHQAIQPPFVKDVTLNNSGSQYTIGNTGIPFGTTGTAGSGTAIITMANVFNHSTGLVKLNQLFGQIIYGSNAALAFDAYVFTDTPAGQYIDNGAWAPNVADRARARLRFDIDRAPYGASGNATHLQASWSGPPISSDGTDTNLYFLLIAQTQFIPASQTFARLILSGQ